MSKILIYHRSKEHFDQGGEITRCYAAMDGTTAEELKKSVDKYNSDSEKKEIAAFVTVEDNSLEMYLYQEAKRAVVYQREAVQDAIASVERALDDLHCLD